MNQYLAEFLGTMFLMYVFLTTGNPLAIGATLAVVMLLTRDVSGGHINPAVSIAMASAGQLPINDLVPYIMAQSLGALVAFELYKRFVK